MPRSSNGTFTFASILRAIAGAVIDPNKYNAVLDDVSQGLTDSLPRDGRAPMTGQLKLADGAVNAPAATFGTALSTGLYKTTDGFALAVGGAKIRDVLPAGLAASWVDLASADTTDLASTPADCIRVTGTTAITAFGTAPSGIRKTLRFADALTLTYNATSLILPGGASIVTATGDTLDLVSLGSGNWACIDYTRATGRALIEPPTRDPSRNRLINGAFQVNQRLAASSADDTYIHDRWYVLTQSGTVAASTLANAENGAPTALRITQSQAGAQRFGVAQIVESVNIRDLRAAVAILTGRLRASASQAIRVAILEHTGTTDTVTSDVVANWASTTYTAGNFFASGLNVIALASVTPTANTWASFPSCSGTFGGGLTNAIVFIWTETTAEQNFTLDLNRVALKAGNVAVPFEEEDASTVLAQCQRYYTKTFPMAIAPAQNSGVVIGAIATRPSGANWSVAGSWQFPSTMRTTPSITTFNPGGTNANWRDWSNGSDAGSPTVDVISDRSMQVGTANSQIAGSLIAIHATADAEL